MLLSRNPGWISRYYCLARCYSSFQDSLKRVNTCKLELQIPIDRNDETSNSTDNSEAKSIITDISKNSDDTISKTTIKRPTPITPEDVQAAIHRFVARETSPKNIGRDSSVGAPGGISRGEEPNIHKYDGLAKKLARKNSSHLAGILPEKFISTCGTTPYEQLLLARGEDLKHRKNNARLSVTKILPYNWCELRSMFEIYNGVFSKPETQPMVRGRKEHSVFEHTTHPAKKYSIDVGGTEMNISIEQTHSFLSADQQPIGPLNERKLGAIYTELDRNGVEVNPVLQELANKWTTTILRLLTLYQFGECREVLVHSLYSLPLGNLLDEKRCTRTSDSTPILDPADYIIISGVIDHLTLEDERLDGAFEAYQDELRDQITDFLDISDLLKQINLESSKWCDRENPLLYMTVKDLKTRRGRSLPHQAQRESARYQVGMYRRFLEILSMDPDLTYRMLLVNAQKRGLDPFEPLPESLVTELVLQNYYLIKDFQRLKDGEPIGFQSFDKETTNSHFKMELKEVTGLPSQLVGDWEKPPSLAYLAARLAQLYHAMNPFFADKNYIEYSCQGEVFRQVEYRYDEKDVDSAIDHGMALWLGQREPNHPFLKSICKDCEFHRQCGWHLRQEGAITTSM